MINYLIEKFGRESYITIRPEKLKEMVESALKKENYELLTKRVGCHWCQFYKYKKMKPTAVSSVTLQNLQRISNVSINTDDIMYVQRGKSRSYKIPAKLIFSDTLPNLLDGWDNYLLGAIASDGTTWGGNIYFKINPDDVEFSAVQVYTLIKFAEKFHEREVNIYIGVDKGKKFGKPTTSVALCNGTFLLFLQNILKLKLRTDYNVPYWFLTSKNFVYSWIAGLTDGDGDVGFHKDKYRTNWFWRLTNGTINPLRNVKKLLISCCDNFDAIPRRESGGKYVLRTSDNNFLVKLLPKILPYCIIERKRERIIQALDYLQQKGFNVKISENQRTTRNLIMDKVVKFLQNRKLLTKLQNWEKLGTYGKQL